MFAQEDYIIKILKLQDCHLRIIKVESEKINQISFTVVHATNTLPTEKCPVCKSNNIARKDCRIRVINHAIVVGFNCLIKYHLLRYYCKDCSKIFNENNNFISPRIQHSNIVIQNILKDCKEICSFRSIAKRYHLSTTTVIKIFTENVKFGRLPLTEVIGVDEFKGTVGFSKYCFIIKDLLNSEIIEILSSRKQEIIEGFLKSIPKNERETVKFIVMDLWKPYRTIFRF
ncbi:MAG: Transposase [Tenericutes bacterium ADurb.Bin140]|nr:MAG: Transposase [Tenericutes bacterium ADurb.Bin140]